MIELKKTVRREMIKAVQLDSKSKVIVEVPLEQIQLYKTIDACELSFNINISATSDKHIITKDGINYSLFSISLTFNSVFD
ncbi:MAG: hypothetical protein SPE30_06175 [Candidatus Treponema excrementipullorum]|nr:hypothetical protein [Candidatus Treponema excrementipullorum]